MAQLANQAALPSQQNYSPQTFTQQTYVQDTSGPASNQQAYTQPIINNTSANQLHHDSNYYSQSSQIASQPSYSYSSVNTYPSSTVNAYYSGAVPSIPSQQYTDTNAYYSKAVIPNQEAQPTYPTSSFNQINPQQANAIPQSQIPSPSYKLGMQDQFSQIQTSSAYGVQSQLASDQQSPYLMRQSNETNTIQNAHTNLYNPYGQVNSGVIPTSSIDSSGYASSLGGYNTGDYSQISTNQYYTAATPSAITPTIAGYGDGTGNLPSGYIQGSSVPISGYNTTPTSYYSDSGYTTTVQHQQSQHLQPQAPQQQQQQPQQPPYIPPDNNTYTASTSVQSSESKYQQQKPDNFVRTMLQSTYFVYNKHRLTSSKIQSKN